MVESNSTDCTYVAVRWTDGGIRCYEIDESKTYTVDTGDTYCKGTSLCTKFVEMVTHNGKDYFEYDGGDERIIEYNCCDCIEGQKEWRFNDEYVCGEDVGQTIGMKYEVWREWKICEFDDSETETGNIEYRNPQKSDDCKVGVYQWREENSDVCGSALPNNTTEVSEAPDLNVDFEE